MQAGCAQGYDKSQSDYVLGIVRGKGDSDARVVMKEGQRKGSNVNGGVWWYK